jgi:uroporphyrinogen III methyltransferase/synthase
MTEPAASRGRVILVGAGPGAPDLITVRGERALRRADAVVFDALASESLLELAPPQALRFNVGKRGHEAPTRGQDDINALLVRLAREGRVVVRLKGGDPYVFGRGAEEASACQQAGIPFEVVPGVTSAVGALSYAGIPVTDRRHAASFAVVTGHKDPTKVREAIRWAGLASVDTIVILMGMRNLSELLGQLIASGRSPATPAAAVMSGTLASQRVVTATLGDLAEQAERAGLHAPAAVVVGDVVRLREQLAWFEALPLFGRRVLVTRQPAQADALCRTLVEAGAEPVRVPLIRTEEVAAPALASALDALARVELLVFTSANGVRAFAAQAAAAGRVAAPQRGRILCVGEATAEAARRAGLPAGRVEASGPDAEAMLDALRREGSLAGQHVLLPRAEGARPLLADGLRQAGARVEELVVYRTVPAPFDAADLRRQLEADGFDALSFASPSAVRSFAEGVGPAGLAAAGRCCVTAVGRVTARALSECGLPADVVPASPETGAWVDALVQHFRDAAPPPRIRKETEG